MKLTLNRTEEQEKYYLHVHLEATPEEMALITKHKWGGGLPVEYVNQNGEVTTFPVVIGSPRRYGFATVEQLAHAESQVIENAKKLKQKLGWAAGFASGGPREVEL
jgi:hypothetical protein